jgi:WD40 repeat protein
VGRDVAVHPDGELFACSTMEDVKIFRLDLSEPTERQLADFRKLTEQLADADQEIRAAAMEKLEAIGLPADFILEEAAGTAKGDHLERIKQLRAQIQSPPPIAALKHEGEVRQVVISPTGNFLATSAMAGDIRIWNPKTFELQHQMKLKLLP